MLRSGNDAAMMISEYIGGTTEEFVNMMNKKAKELGMKKLPFITPVAFQPLVVIILQFMIWLY